MIVRCYGCTIMQRSFSKLLKGFAVLLKDASGNNIDLLIIRQFKKSIF